MSRTHAIAKRNKPAGSYAASPVRPGYSRSDREMLGDDHTDDAGTLGAGTTAGTRKGPTGPSLGFVPARISRARRWVLP
jgi:hypothetical protein